MSSGVYASSMTARASRPVRSPSGRVPDQQGQGCRECLCVTRWDEDASASFDNLDIATHRGSDRREPHAMASSRAFDRFSWKVGKTKMSLASSSAGTSWRRPTGLSSRPGTLPVVGQNRDLVRPVADQEECDPTDHIRGQESGGGGQD